MTRGTRAGLAARWALAALALVSATAVQAGLFDDDEARRAILDLRAKVEQLQQQNQKETQARQAETAETIALLKRSLLDLNNQIEALRADIAKLRGTDEQLTRDMGEVQRRQKEAPNLSGALGTLEERLKPLEDRIKPLEERLKRLEPVKVSQDGVEFLAAPDEKKAFDDAVAPIRSGDFAAAATALSAFLRNHPGSGYTDAATYWLGNAQYGKRDYKDAIGTFRALISASPKHPRAPEALLAIANCQVELKETKAAKRTLDELLKNYPRSEAASAGRQRIAMLK
jgi:tol-pal system protein YbgF